MAVERVYRAEGMTADWWLDSPMGCDVQSLKDFAASADLVVHCPVIGQNWSFTLGERVHPPGEDIFPVELEARRRAYLFHGSMNLAYNVAEYTRLYRETGVPILCTTLDYVMRMEGDYVPSIVDVQGRAPLRDDDLRVVHATTDERMTATQEFVSACKRLGIRADVISGVSHPECIATKKRYNAGFDHIRGSFSVNSLENAALGLVNLVGTTRNVRSWLKDKWDILLPWPGVETMTDVSRELVRHKDNKNLTRDMQDMAADWFSKAWNPQITAGRIIEAYERAAN